MLKLEILNTSACVAIFLLSKELIELFNNINKVDPSFTQLDTKEQVNILLYGYPPNKSNVLNQDIIKFVINFLKKSSHFDKPLISPWTYMIRLNQRFYVLLFSFLPICLLYVFFVRKCKSAADNWLQISCINKLLLINSSLLLLFLYL